MITYQQFLSMYAVSPAKAVVEVVDAHKKSDVYQIAVDADEYDHQRNVTITNYEKTMRTLTGAEVPDPFAANYKLPCNMFRRLNTQRVEYSLGSGVSFDKKDVKDKLGKQADKRIKDLAYAACIHGVAFGFWNLDKLHVFKLPEFAPLYDETTGALRAGVRFWQLGEIADKNPLNIWLYAEDGITKFVKNYNSDTAEMLNEKPEPYVGIVKRSLADGETIIDGENYSALPIVPMWGSELKQSTLVGMRQGIDSYDLIRSGLANDLTDAAYIYWLVTNAGGMNDYDKAKLLQELRTKHMGVADSGAQTEGGESNKASITAFTQDVPHEARTAYLDRIKAGLYEDFGGLDVHTIAAGSTNDHIDAAYQPLDENADDFEYQIIEFVQNVLALQNVDEDDATPIFKRNRISNQTEQTAMVLAAGAYLDEETIIKHLPWISVDEFEDIMKRKKDEDAARYRAQEEELAMLREEAQRQDQTQDQTGTPPMEE